MGARGFNAGGFAYMKVAACPRCGRKRLWGNLARERGETYCGGGQDDCNKNIARREARERKQREIEQRKAERLAKRESKA